MKSKVLNSFPILRYAKAAAYAALTSTAIVGIQASANENPYSSEDLYFSTEESCNSFQADKMKASYISHDEVTDSIRAEALNDFGITIPPKPQEPDFGPENPLERELGRFGDRYSEEDSYHDIQEMYHTIKYILDNRNVRELIEGRGMYHLYLKNNSEYYNYHTVYDAMIGVTPDVRGLSSSEEDELAYTISDSDIKPTTNDIRYLRMLDYMDLYDRIYIDLDYERYRNRSGQLRQNETAELIETIHDDYFEEVNEDRHLWQSYQDAYNQYSRAIHKYNIAKYEIPQINSAIVHWQSYGSTNYDYTVENFDVSDLYTSGYNQAAEGVEFDDYIKSSAIRLDHRSDLCANLLGFSSIKSDEDYRYDNGLVYGPTDPGLIDALSCNLNDGRCFITVNGLSVNGNTDDIGPYFCRSKTMAFDQQAFANGSDMLNMLLMTYASGLKASFRLSADCTGEYPTLNHIELFRGS